LKQFLLEALILSSGGGVLGGMLGVGAVSLVAIFTPLPATVGPVIVLNTVGFSGLIGLFFGVVPARRAASLDPIVALRSL
jgi:putative ABC transport system permease protein